MHYYNEWDKDAADWLEALIADDELPKGIVDRRSVMDVTPSDLKGFTQCHLFAGIGGWPLALRVAGVPADTHLWTASCPCQPFSTANTNGNKGRQDERHLLPKAADLIRECKPDIVLGEQVRAAINHGWLDELCDLLEPEGYAVGATVLSSEATGAVHKRERLFWGAHASSAGRQGLEHYDRLSFGPKAPFAFHRDGSVDPWGALVESVAHILPRDALPVTVERRALKGFGNAIDPVTAAGFITAFLGAAHDYT